MKNPRPPFEGTTEQCLAHLAEVCNPEQRSYVTQFTRMEDVTVRRWFSHQRSPLGESLIRLRYYLEFLGYQVLELKLLADPIRDTGRLYAFDVFSLDDLCEQIDLPKTRSSLDQLLPILLGKRGVSEERMRKFIAVVETFGPLLEDVLSTTPRFKLFEADQTAVPSQPPREEAVTSNPDTTANKNREAILASVADMARAMLPLVDRVLSDDFTPEERAKVRQKAGVDVIFKLSTRLNRLCGEQARRELPQQ